MKLARFFEAHFVPGAHFVQVSIKAATVFGIGGPRKVLDVSVKEKPVVRRRLIHNRDEFCAAHRAEVKLAE